MARGGTRAGAGRPKGGKNEPVLSASTSMLTSDPKAFLLALMNDPMTDIRIRADAAKSLMPFVHERKGEAGKKQQAADKAKTAATGRFAPKSPPKLVAVR